MFVWNCIIGWILTNEKESKAEFFNIKKKKTVFFIFENYTSLTYTCHVGTNKSKCLFICNTCCIFICNSTGNKTN
jgi:hypothetical protein